MIDPTSFMRDVFATWTERDVEARRAAIRAHFHEAVTFYDHDGVFVGHAALEKFSDSLQSRFPGAQFSFASPPQLLGNALRVFWHFGPPANPQAVDGMDFVILDGDKIATLYAFVNVPT